MAKTNLRERTISAMIWSSMGTFGTTIVNFVSNMVLARLLMPEDFGCIGMLQIFISVGDTFVTAGFGQALIQKKNPTHLDYSTVFIWNMVASVVLYFILFISAPAIGAFYKMPLLCSVLRVQSLNLILFAFIVVQNNQMRKLLMFKELSIRNIVAALSGTVVAVIMALFGFGVWSLVASSLVSGIASIFLLWNMSSWRPSLEFSWKSFRELFSFGGLIAISTIVEKVYNNIQGVIIGRWYSAIDMGYYSQAAKLEQVPNHALSQVVSQVSYPVFSQLQDSIPALRQGVRKNIRSLVFINFPLCLLLFVVASPLIHLLYGMKWDASIPYFRLLCISGMIYSTNAMNNNVVKALGKGNVFLFSQLLKRAIGLILIFIGATKGIYGLLCAVIISSYLNFIINSVVNKRLIGYGFVSQIKDIGGTLLVALFSTLISLFFGYCFSINQYVLLVIQVVLFCLSYLFISLSFKLEAYYTYKSIILDYYIRFTHK